jgi:glycosyltransferase involved in cell wall biosynthesis
MPYFSLIIPAYNRAFYLPKAIESVMAQTFIDWELIVVDDASTDNTEEIVSSFVQKEERIRYLKNKTNQERCVSRNRGIEAAAGKYICFLDSDDYHLPEHLAVLHEAILEKKEPEAVFFVNAWDETAQGVRRERTCPPLEDHELFTYLLTYTFNPQRTAIHKSIFCAWSFDPKIPGLEDFDFFLCAATRFPVYQIKKRTTVYVMHEGAYTMSAERPEKELGYFRYIFEKPELKSVLPASPRKRLLSMSYFHMAARDFKRGNGREVWNYGMRSFLLYPRGYNGRTNKPLAVMLLYSVPILGRLISGVVKSRKRN